MALAGVQPGRAVHSFGHGFTPTAARLKQVACRRAKKLLLQRHSNDLQSDVASSEHANSKLGCPESCLAAGGGSTDTKASQSRRAAPVIVQSLFRRQIVRSAIAAKLRSSVRASNTHAPIRRPPFHALFLCLAGFRILSAAL